MYIPIFRMNSRPESQYSMEWDNKPKEEGERYNG